MQSSVENSELGASTAPRSNRTAIEVAVFSQSPNDAPALRQLFAAHSPVTCKLYDLASAQRDPFFHRIDAAVVVGDPALNDATATLSHLDDLQMPTLVLTDRTSSHAADLRMVMPVNSDAVAVEAALTAFAVARRMARHHMAMQESLRNATQRFTKSFEEMDQELRLASRLQRDFLPKDGLTIGPLRFSMIYRPSNWVSGDIFDVFPLEDGHVGMYLADAVGHGVAAGLLTMYIKHSITVLLQSKQFAELHSPACALSCLNDRLAAQNLPDAQFITAWYGAVDLATLQMEFAVAGHPPPLLVSPDGTIRELRSDGCLMGLWSGQQFLAETVQLTPGDRVLIYSDGLEPTLISERRPAPEPSVFPDDIRAILREPTATVIAKLTDKLESAPGSLNEADDVSLILMEVGLAHHT